MMKFKLLTSVLVAMPLLTQCGAANVNKIFGSDDESYAGLLQRAELAYDQGDYDAAESLANKAYGRSANNGDAGVLLGNIYLSKAGVDIFQIVRKLSTLSSGGSSSSGGATDSCASASTTKTSGNVLSELSCKLLNLSAADKEALGTNKPVNGLSSINVTSVYVPNEVNDTLRTNVKVLAALDKGIRKLCPFVSRSLVLSQSTDTRHLDASICPDRSNSTFNGPKVHISFALLHLVESLVFQQGVLIDGVSSSASGYTGVQTVSTKIGSAQFSSISEFVSAVSSFQGIVNSVFDTTNANSQISLALNGLVMVSQGFEAAGVPSSVTSVITSQLTKLRETANKLKTASPGGTDSSYQTQALKGQMNEAYAKSVATKINAQCPTKTSPGCGATEQASLCASYAGISQGVDPTKVTTPVICQ